MTEGIVKIYLSYVEPRNKELLWMRPYLDKEGYELLFYGSKGWTPWHFPCNKEGPIKDDCKELPEHPVIKDRPCGCLKG